MFLYPKIQQSEKQNNYFYLCGMATPQTVPFSYTRMLSSIFAETSTIRRQFEDASYEVVDFEEGANIYVINTCSVTNLLIKNADMK